jgi:uncharacterized protein YigE (DUF2233 family)
VNNPLRTFLRRRLYAALAVVCAIGVTFGLIRISPTRTPAPLVANAGVRVHDLAFGDRRYTVCEVDLTRARLELFWKRPDGTRYGSFAKLMAEHPLAFATNAGIFDPTFTPCGLLVADGREGVPLNLQNGAGNFFLKPDGVFVIDGRGASVIESSRYTGTVATTRLATQSGPMLVIDGAIHPQFNRDSANRRVRSGVGVRSPDRVVFAISREPVTFFEFATLFRDRLDCPNALYLDGEISRFYIPGNADQQDGEFGGILAVTAK